MEIYQKLFNARKYIKTCEMTKLGHNDYSNYDYYTPSQISQLVFQACEDQQLIPKFDLIRNELGITGKLTIINLSAPNEFIYFDMASDIPEIKATNAAQQLGGAVTYTERYLLMIAFDIKDNNLDPDTSQNTQKRETKTTTTTAEKDNKIWLNKFNKDKSKVLDLYTKVLNGAKEKGKTVTELREFYKINKEVAAELEKDLNNETN